MASTCPEGWKQVDVIWKDRFIIDRSCFGCILAALVVLLIVVFVAAVLLLLALLLLKSYAPVISSRSAPYIETTPDSAPTARYDLGSW